MAVMKPLSKPSSLLTTTMGPRKCIPANPDISGMCCNLCSKFTLYFPTIFIFTMEKSLWMNWQESRTNRLACSPPPSLFLSRTHLLLWEANPPTTTLSSSSTGITLAPGSGLSSTSMKEIRPLEPHGLAGVQPCGLLSALICIGGGSGIQLSTGNYLLKI